MSERETVIVRDRERCRGTGHRGLRALERRLSRVGLVTGHIQQDHRGKPPYLCSRKVCQELHRKFSKIRARKIKSPRAEVRHYLKKKKAEGANFSIQFQAQNLCWSVGADGSGSAGPRRGHRGVNTQHTAHTKGARTATPPREVMTGGGHFSAGHAVMWIAVSVEILANASPHSSASAGQFVATISLTEADASSLASAAVRDAVWDAEQSYTRVRTNLSVRAPSSSSLTHDGGKVSLGQFFALSDVRVVKRANESQGTLARDSESERSMVVSLASTSASMSDASTISPENCRKTPKNAEKREQFGG